MADQTLSTSCCLDEEAHHIANEFSFEEKDPFSVMTRSRSICTRGIQNLHVEKDTFMQIPTLMVQKRMEVNDRSNNFRI